MSIRIIKLLPLAAALTLSSVASASSIGELPSVVVRYGDLNLSTKGGVASLHSRLRHAAKQVCEPLDSRVLDLREQYADCVSDAVRRSVAKVNNSNLTRFHRYGKHVDESEAG
jgi:UrcA family protein